VQFVTAEKTFFSLKAFFRGNSKSQNRFRSQIRVSHKNMNISTNIPSRMTKKYRATYVRTFPTYLRTYLYLSLIENIGSNIFLRTYFFEHPTTKKISSSEFESLNFSCIAFREGGRGRGGFKGISTTYEIYNTRRRTTSHDNNRISYAGSRRGSAEV
jgi:hypothetical protein